MHLREFLGRYHVILSKRPLERPSPRELHKKLAEVRKLIADGQWRPHDHKKLYPNFEELEQRFNVEVASDEDQRKILLVAAGEVTPDDYAGDYPPEKSYEASISGEDLFAFCWNSEFFKVRMYFKFALKGADKGRKAYICSIHESRN